MTQKFANNATSALAAGITAGAVNLSVKAGDGAKFPALAAGEYFLATLYQVSGVTEINHEVVKVTARTNDAFTIERAQEGTTARAFNADDPIQLRFTADTAARAMQGATGAGSNHAFFLNDATVTASFTIPTGKNAGMFGPVTINDGAVVTVPDGSVLTIV